MKKFSIFALILLACFITTVNAAPVKIPAESKLFASVGYSPGYPLVNQAVTISAHAQDNATGALVTSIKIYLDGSLVQTCSPNKIYDTCTYSRNFSSSGMHYYYAIATSNALTTVRSPISGNFNFTVFDSCSDSDYKFYPTINVYQKGTVYWHSTSFSDVCINNTMLREYYCTSAAGYSSAIYNCMDGCSNGACRNGTTVTKQNSAQPVSTQPFEMPYDELPGGGSDSTPPFVYTWISPENPSINSMVWINANATDNIQLKSLTVYLDNEKIGECKPYSQYASCGFSRNIYNGAHFYHAVAMDTSGNTAIDGQKNFTLAGSRVSYVNDANSTNSTNSTYDNKAPNVYIYALVSGQKITLTASATDASPISNVKIFLDNKVVKICEKTSSGLASPCVYTNLTMSSGQHTYRAEATDSAGNTGRHPATGEKTFTIGVSPIKIQAGLPGNVFDGIASYFGRIFSKLA